MSGCDNEGEGHRVLIVRNICRKVSTNVDPNQDPLGVLCDNAMRRT